MSITLVTWEQVGDAMLAQLAPIHLTEAGKVGAYLRQLAWHAGEFSSREALMQSGIAGRCPGVLVDFGGEKTVRTSVGGRTEFVEAMFLAICVSDSLRSTRDRELSALMPLVRDVRRRLHGRRLGLEIERLHYDGTQLVAQDTKLFAFAAKFRTRFHVDLTVAPPDAVDLGTMHADLTRGGATVVSTTQATNQ